MDPREVPALQALGPWGGCRGAGIVCQHPARGCGDPLRTPRVTRVGLGWHLPFPAGAWPARAAPSPHNWQGAACLPALRDESWSFRGAGEEPGPGSSPCSPRAATSELSPGCSTASKSLGD